MGYSERRRQSEAYWRDQEYRMGLTAKDNWEGNEDGYIKHLLGLSGHRWRVVNGEKDLVEIRGFEFVDENFAEYDNKDSYSYNHAVGRGYLDWMLMVRARYNYLKSSNQIKDIDKAKAEREEHDYWVRYYDQNPQFSRPKGYENDGSVSSNSSSCGCSGGSVNPKFAQIMKNLGCCE